MSRRLQDARTEAARWRSLIRSVVAGAMAAAVRSAAITTMEGFLGRKLTEAELGVFDGHGPDLSPGWLTRAIGPCRARLAPAQLSNVRSWVGLERIPGSSPFASGGPVGMRPGEVPAILSRGHELPFSGHPHSFTSLDGVELGRCDELMEEAKDKVRASHQVGAEAVLYVIEDGVAREVGRVPPGGLQLQLDRKPRW